ncbi:GIY-YIG nuclease family protein [Streptomonospora wellingtoniae]|uniref:GIY-YIG nuclease family protein n=1 Tax=Streptomonospora wellingtoniae TaxID=3075544 RepID=A0ABU2KUS1_9ACTN|nr:GIY-YIG nuclease family protein [Streptomonospora sp. DSM 45055]MDT0302936.1 GIY-YIG nuclease family protein [Streptomonospora sp. DSM 45055]
MAKHALYRFYSDSGQLLYTGITNDPGRRFTEHAKEKHWWTKIRGITVDWYDDRDSVLSAEKRAIRIESPLHNVRDKHTPASDEDEFSYEDHVHMNAAIAATGGRRVDQTFFKEVADRVDEALGLGYSYREITNAAEGFSWVEDSVLTEHLPAYPGQLDSSEIENLNDAHTYLAAFIPSEIEQFSSQARAEPEMARAHAHEFTIRAFEIAQDVVDAEGRDLEALSGFLSSVRDGRECLEWAQQATGRDAIFPLPIDCRAVIELAVARRLGTWTPQNAPTSEFRWRELVRHNH